MRVNNKITRNAKQLADFARRREAEMDKVDICVRLRATGLQLSHEAAREIEWLRNVIYRMYRDEVEYTGCNNVRDWERDYPWIMDLAGINGGDDGD